MNEVGIVLIVLDPILMLQDPIRREHSLKSIFNLVLF
jgi:hypothetical protein